MARSHGSVLLAATNLPQDMIAERCGVSQVSVSYWVSGTTKPRGEKRRALAEHFAVPIEAWDEAPPVAAPVAPAQPAPAPPVAPPAPRTMADGSPFCERCWGDGFCPCQCIELLEPVLPVPVFDPFDGVTFEPEELAEPVTDLADAWARGAHEAIQEQGHREVMSSFEPVFEGGLVSKGDAAPSPTSPFQTEKEGFPAGLEPAVAPPAPPAAGLPPATPARILDRAGRLEAMIDRMLTKLESSEHILSLGDVRMAKTCADTLNSLAKLRGESEIGPKFLRGAFWVSVKECLHRGLRGHPEAAAQVQRELMKLDEAYLGDNADDDE